VNKKHCKWMRVLLPVLICAPILSRMQNIAGNKTGNRTGNRAGNKTGNRTGNRTGNKTGNRTGNKTYTMTLAHHVNKNELFQKRK
jgi:hypothetical protein